MTTAIETTPAKLDAAALQKLQSTYDQASANRRNGTQYPSNPTPPPPAPVVETVAPRVAAPVVIPPDNGSYRQTPNYDAAPNVPNTIPNNLPKGIPIGQDYAPIPAPRYVPNQYSKNNLPNPQIPLQNRIGNLAERAGNYGNKISDNAGKAAGALAVGGALSNLAKAPSLSNAAAAAGGILLLIPNPYAQGLGLALSLLSPVLNMFESQQNLKKNQNNNNSGIDTINNPIGVAGEAYALEFCVLLSDNSFRYSTGANTKQEPHSVQEIMLYGSNNNCQYAAPISGGVTISGGNGFDVGGVFRSGNYFGTGAFGLTPTSVFINQAIRISDSNPVSNDLNDLSYLNSSNQDGYPKPDFDALKEKISALEQAIKNRTSPEDQNENLLEVIKKILPQNNNNSTPSAPTRTPQPLLAPKATSSTPALSSNLKLGGSTNFVPNKSPFPDLNKLKAPIPETVPAAQPQSTLQDLLKLNDRFKDPKDCKFSCEEFAKCFTDLTVQFFDGCDPNTGSAKTKDITIQVLPKDKLKTSSIFQEFLNIRSKECSLNDRVLTVPEYWQIRLGQRPQAAILYREFKDGKFTDTYYTLHIPHYNGNKNTKPTLTQYSKGETSAIYVCKDNSKLTVYASNEAEAKRVINQMEKCIDPKFRGDIVKFGTRTGIKKTTVKPIRLDFYSTGQLKLSPDWSIAL